MWRKWLQDSRRFLPGWELPFSPAWELTDRISLFFPAIFTWEIRCARVHQVRVHVQYSHIFSHICRRVNCAVLKGSVPRDKSSYGSPGDRFINLLAFKEIVKTKWVPQVHSCISLSWSWWQCSNSPRRWHLYYRYQVACISLSWSR